MNSISALFSQACGTLNHSVVDSARLLPAEEQSPGIEDRSDLMAAGADKVLPSKISASGIASGGDATTEKVTASEGDTSSSAAFQTFAATGKIAASCIGGVSGHAIGITIESLKESKAEIEKGYHLPENYISAYYERRILPYQNNPTYRATDDYLYRGMYITVNELANILGKGFEVKHNTWTAVGGKGVYLSSSIREADDYIFQSVDFNKKHALGVVFKMEKGDYAQLVDDPLNNPTNTIFKAPGDVPRDKIIDIYLRGQYGLESLGDIIEKAKSKEIKPNSSWVNQFDSYIMR